MSKSPPANNESTPGGNAACVGPVSTMGAVVTGTDAVGEMLGAVEAPLGMPALTATTGRGDAAAVGGTLGRGVGMVFLA